MGRSRLKNESQNLIWGNKNPQIPLCGREAAAGNAPLLNGGLGVEPPFEPAASHSPPLSGTVLVA